MKRFFSETYFQNPENKKALEHYPLIGDGKDGEVYRLTHNKCIKYFLKKRHVRRNWKLYSSDMVHR